MKSGGDVAVEAGAGMGFAVVDAGGKGELRAPGEDIVTNSSGGDMMNAASSGLALPVGVVWTPSKMPVDLFLVADLRFGGTTRINAGGFLGGVYRPGGGVPGYGTYVGVATADSKFSAECDGNNECYQSFDNGGNWDVHGGGFDGSDGKIPILSAGFLFSAAGYSSEERKTGGNLMVRLGLVAAPGDKEHSFGNGYTAKVTWPLGPELSLAYHFRKGVL